jgi:hypothetical protein
MDYFAYTVNWRIHSGHSKFRTYTGAFLSIAMAIIWLEFCLERLITMILKTDISVNDFTKLNVLDEFYNYPNFTVAFGISSYLNADP